MKSTQETIAGAIEEAKEGIRQLVSIIKEEVGSVGLTDEEQFMTFIMAATISKVCEGEKIALASNFAAALMIRDLEAKLQEQK
jgi:hypothetical protein